MKVSRKRETKETSIDVILDTNGANNIIVETGIELLDEILKSFAKGSGFELFIKARGDLETGDHHTAEDTGIALGSTLSEVIKTGIGSSVVPSGQTLALAAVRFGESGYRGDFEFQAKVVGGMSLENFGHFLRALAYNGIFTLAIRADGGDDRSKIEAICTAVGRAVQKAARDKNNRGYL
ncbi:MAG: imidazoleglycerol-phosphate dehydratase [Methanothrix sp.]|jgi:imidazoleglycerol-phosphate dehydratase|nr:imidazoleglycerol-phosphate dehydratase [Methanothrix sp.]